MVKLDLKVIIWTILFLRIIYIFKRGEIDNFGPPMQLCGDGYGAKLDAQGTPCFSIGFPLKKIKSPCAALCHRDGSCGPHSSARNWISSQTPYPLSEDEQPS